MKTASKVFIIIGLVASIIILFMGIGIAFSGNGVGDFYIIYGFYSLFTSIFSLVSVRGESKGKIIVAGVLYIPVMLIASIFMFCIKEEDL